MRPCQAKIIAPCTADDNAKSTLLEQGNEGRADWFSRGVLYIDRWRAGLYAPMCGGDPSESGTTAQHPETRLSISKHFKLSLVVSLKA